MRQRTGKPAEELSPDHPAWAYETQYIGYAIANIVCTLSPRRVILGGSVSKGGQSGEDAFFRAVRRHVQPVLKGYVVSPALLGDSIHDYIVPPDWVMTQVSVVDRTGPVCRCLTDGHGAARTAAWIRAAKPSSISRSRHEFKGSGFIVLCSKPRQRPIRTSGWLPRCRPSSAHWSHNP